MINESNQPHIRLKEQITEGNSKFNSALLPSLKFKETFTDYETVMFNCINAIKHIYNDKAFFMQALMYQDIKLIVIDNEYNIEFILEDEALDLVSEYIPIQKDRLN